MKKLAYSLVTVAAIAASTSAQDVVVEDVSANTAPQFTSPVRLKAAGELIQVEKPGYAAPCLHDVNGDGRLDLVVGQFNGGKMRIYHGQKDGTFGKGQWLEVDGEVAKVPGVW